MKAEQACRFRLDEGYCVFAKSPDLQPAQEEALGDIFNSTMNNLFPSVGSSVLSCAASSHDVFLARNTLRTDIHGRKTMFTHAYILPKAEYARLMQEEPMTVLGVEMSSMLESQSAGAVMPAVELTPTAQAEPLEALFAKYNLDKVRYGRLLLGAYLAITHSTSLQLVTRLPLDQTPAMVRELTLCILEGLMPILKGKLTFSTGNDPRMHISVISTAHTSNPSGELMFGVEDDRYTTVRPRDELSELVFYTLAELSHAERVRSVERMQQWLAQTTNIQEGLALTLICTAFCMTSGMQMGTDTLLMLFRSISDAPRIAPDVANKLLADLVKTMRESTGCSTGALSLFAGRYLRAESSDVFRAEADQAFRVAPMEVCIALAEAMFRQDMTDPVRQLLRTLLRRIPADDAGISQELRTNLILWILREDEQEFIQYATVLMQGCDSLEYVKLALGILDSVGEKPLTQVQETILTKALGYMAEKKLAMSDAYAAALDGICTKYSPELAQSALDFFFKVRLARLDAEEGLALVETLVEQHRDFAVMIAKAMHAGANPAVWERFQTKRRFPDGMDHKEVYFALQEHNTFQNPGGPMEKRAVECCRVLFQDSFDARGEDTTEMSYYSDPLVNAWYGYTEKLNLSRQMKDQLEHILAEIFWKSVTYEQIYRNKYPIHEKVLMDPQIDRIKMTVALACLQIRQDPGNAADFVQEITNGETDEDMRQALMECAQRMTFALLNEHNFLSWDLILCSCWKITEKENGPDTKLFLQRCENLDELFEKKRQMPQLQVDASRLLADEKLRKTVCKLSSDSNIFQRLMDQIKPERSGFLGFLKGSKKESRESDSRYGDAFDPTVPFEPDDRRKDKKRR